MGRGTRCTISRRECISCWAFVVCVGGIFRGLRYRVKGEIKILEIIINYVSELLLLVRVPFLIDLLHDSRGDPKRATEWFSNKSPRRLMRAVRASTIDESFLSARLPPPLTSTLFCQSWPAPCAKIKDDSRKDRRSHRRSERQILLVRTTKGSYSTLVNSTEVFWLRFDLFEVEASIQHGGELRNKFFILAASAGLFLCRWFLFESQKNGHEKAI